MSRRLALFALISGGSLAACGGGPQRTPLEDPSDFEAREVVPLRREHCPAGMEQLLDANGNGVANIRHVSNDGRRVCSEYDINLDGQTDVMRTFEEGGAIAFEQHDFDFDGRLDQQSFFSGGKLARKELDTNFDRYVDTWIWCEGAYITRLERDRHHTGRVDTWQEYQRGVLSTVRYDDNNDGRIERWESYRAGRLAEVAYDGNMDGQPDRTEPQQLATAQGALEPVSCDGNAIEQLAAAAPQPPQAAPPESDSGAQP